MRRLEQSLPRAMRMRARSTDSCLIPVSKCFAATRHNCCCLVLDIIVVVWFWDMACFEELQPILIGLICSSGGVILCFFLVI